MAGVLNIKPASKVPRMSLDETVNAFKMLACGLGAPMEVLPNDDALRLIFKTPQGDMLFNLMNKVRARQTAVTVQRNILLSKMRHRKDLITPAARNLLPNEMQIYSKIEDLKKRKEKVESKLSETKSENEGLAGAIKGMNIQKIQLNHKREMLNVKANILDIKAHTLDNDIQNEENYKERIMFLMPVTIKPSNANESLAMNAIRESLEVLEELNNICIDNSQEIKNSLWIKLRNIFLNVPRYLLWSAVLKISDKQLQNKISFPKINSTESETNNNFTSFEMGILKTRTMFFKILSKCVDEKKETIIWKKKYLAAYESFVNNFQLKIRSYNSEPLEHLQNIMSDYICKYTTRAFARCQSEFFEKEISFCKAKLVDGAQKIEDHQLLLASTRKIYDETDSYVNRIMQDISQLAQIKEKIVYLKNLAKYMSDPFKRNTNIHVKNIGNLSGSFDISDNLLCSTKIDLENSFANSTLRLESTSSSNKFKQTAQIMNELIVFKDLKMEKLKYMSKDCSFYLDPNPLITNNNESFHMLQLVPSVLQTPNGSLQTITKKIKWNERIQKYQADFNTSLFGIRENTLFTNCTAQQEQITEILDEIKCLGLQTKQQFGDLKKYYTFILENPLRLFIRSTKLFNERTYRDYESEYAMLYRMVSSSHINE